MRPDDFFETRLEDLDDGWSLTEVYLLRRDLLQELRQRPLATLEDLSVASALARMAQQELEAYGTDGRMRLSDDDAQLALRALRACLRRLEIEFDPPWRNLTTFRSHWLKEGCSGSWQARRDLLEVHFEPVHQRLFEMEEAAFTAELAEAVSPHPRTGWVKVDAEIDQLKRRFRQAGTPQDYRAIGTHCVGVLEALSRTVYDPALHLRPGEKEPPVDRTKQRLERYVEVQLAGAQHETLRALVRKSIELAHEVKHREAPNRRDAGIAADTVILVANLLRRLVEQA